MRLYHNLASLNVYKEQTKVQARQSRAMERISSGSKVNNAKENPNVISQSERFRMQIRGTEMAARNVQDGVSMLQTTEGGLDSITQMLQRARELVIQGSNGTYTGEEKSAIQSEISELMRGIDGVARTTDFNGVKLLYNEDVTDNAKPGGIFMPSGANTGERIEIPTFNLTFNSGSLKMADGTVKNLSALDITKGTTMDEALDMIDSAMDTVIGVRSQYGALENRFESSYQSLNEIGEKLTGAESTIRDADIAEEMMELAKDNVLSEAGNAIMAQTNRLPQDVLRILESMRK